jgi:hypothetical protein
MVLLKVVPKKYEISLSLSEEDYKHLLDGLHAIFESHVPTDGAISFSMDLHDALVKQQETMPTPPARRVVRNK